ncbi:MAG: flavin reductase family protein [Minisyncoccales bacterium]
MTASFLMPISFEPKYLAISVSPKRKTFENLSKTKEFSLNLLSEEMKKEAQICGSLNGEKFDKFKAANLKKEKAKFIKPPLIKNCPISFECQVELMKEFGDHFLVVGKVLREVVRKKDFLPLLHKTGEIFLKISRNLYD